MTVTMTVTKNKVQCPSYSLSAGLVDFCITLLYSQNIRESDIKVNQTSTKTITTVIVYTFPLLLVLYTTSLLSKIAKFCLGSSGYLVNR